LTAVSLAQLGGLGFLRNFVLEAAPFFDAVDRIFHRIFIHQSDHRLWALFVLDDFVIEEAVPSVADRVALAREGIGFGDKNLTDNEMLAIFIYVMEISVVQVIFVVAMLYGDVFAGGRMFMDMKLAAGEAVVRKIFLVFLSGVASGKSVVAIFFGWFGHLDVLSFERLLALDDIVEGLLKAGQNSGRLGEENFRFRLGFFGDGKIFYHWVGTKGRPRNRWLNIPDRSSRIRDTKSNRDRGNNWKNRWPLLDDRLHFVFDG